MLPVRLLLSSAELAGVLVETLVVTRHCPQRGIDPQELHLQSDCAEVRETSTTGNFHAHISLKAVQCLIPSYESTHHSAFQGNNRTNFLNPSVLGLRYAYSKLAAT